MAKETKQTVEDEQPVEAASEPQEEQTATEPAEQPDKAEQLQKDLDAAMDAHMRTLAEYDNYRKRTAKEKEAAYGDAKADVLKDLLPVLDNIERSTKAQQTDLDSYKKGMDMIFHSFSQALDKIGLESFGNVGDKFDPKLHNAVMHIEDDSLGEEVVTDVFAKGYKLGERILRPAMVKVAN